MEEERTERRARCLLIFKRQEEREKVLYSANDSSRSCLFFAGGESEDKDMLIGCPLNRPGRHAAES